MISMADAMTDIKIETNKDPVIVYMLMRTGTTLLFCVLNSDPRLEPFAFETSNGIVVEGGGFQHLGTKRVRFDLDCYRRTRIFSTYAISNAATLEQFEKDVEASLDEWAATFDRKAYRVVIHSAEEAREIKALKASQITMIERLTLERDNATNQVVVQKAIDSMNKERFRKITDVASIAVETLDDNMTYTIRGSELKKLMKR